MTNKENEKIARPLVHRKSNSGLSFLLTLINNEKKRNIVIFILISLFTTILLFPYKYKIEKKYSANDVAEEDIRVQNDIAIIDEMETEILREKSGKKAPQIYDYDKNKKEKLLTSIQNSFSTMRKYLGTVVSSKELKSRRDNLHVFHEESEKFQEKMQLVEKEFDLLKNQKFSKNIEDGISSILSKLLDNKIIDDKATLFESRSSALVLNIIDKNSQTQKTKINDWGGIIDLEVAREQLEIIAEKDVTFAKILHPIRKDILNLAKRLVQPNLQLNHSETTRVAAIEREKVKNVTLNLKKGEIIVREGDRITENHLMILNQIEVKFDLFHSIKTFLGVLIFSMFIFFAIYYFVKQNIKTFEISTKNILFLGVIFLLTFVLLNVSKFVADSVYGSFGGIPYFAYFVIVPTFGLPMIVSLILETEIALTFILAQLIFVGLWGVLKGLNEVNSIYYIAYYVVGSFFAIREIAKITWRITLFKIGLFTGLINSLSVILIALISDEIGVGFSSFCYLAFFALACGILSSIVVLGIVPIIESFGFTTNFSLLELANTDHPLLSRLAIQAPGTYHHSFIVSRLAENAADEIGANSLLTKVATLYHDIGKIEKSQYFIENQVGSLNKHDKLTPRMSSLIIISHVKEGVELAKRYKLPEIIIDIISQHHGTSVISYFYSKAKEKEDADLESVYEGDYSYPGPKPQSKEAAIIMLADATEATCRSLSEPTPARLKAIVGQVVNRFFTEGQMDECKLTFKELDIISKSFLSILSKSIYHHRIEYPGRQAKEVTDTNKKEISNGNTDSKQPKKAKNQSENNSKNHKECT